MSTRRWPLSLKKELRREVESVEDLGVARPTIREIDEST
jgi:hypothetical protein